MKHKKNLVKIAIFMIVVTLSTSLSHAYAEAPTQPIKTSWTPAEVRAMAISYADDYGIPEKVMETIIMNESHYAWNDKRDLKDGSYTSWGACQIHLPDHPDVTKQQALDPAFCLNWTAEKIKEGHARMWTTYVACYLNEPVYTHGKRIKISCSAIV